VTQSQIFEQQRQLLYRWIWPPIWPDTGGVPTNAEDAVEIGWNGVNLLNAVRVDRLRFDVAYGCHSYVYASTPLRPLVPPRALIVHHGHADILTAFGIQPSTEYWLGRGFHIFNVAMPLYNPNNYGHSVQTRSGSVLIGPYQTHNCFRNLIADGELVSPLRVFLDPVIRLVNYIVRTMGVSTVAMAGLSGGGWTTHMAPIYDQRITLSYPVAGYQPKSVYPAADYEQGAGNLAGVEYLMVPVPSMFALAAYPGRRVWQILNWKDQYYPYVGNEAAVDAYVADTKAQLQGNTLGFFDLRVDTTTADQEHVLSADSRAFIANDILAHAT
jgi:hypothetical protein